MAGQDLLAPTLASVAAGGVGWLSGSLTAGTGHDPVVIGAVVPVMISAMGALVGIQVGRGQSKPTIAASLFVLSFCAFFFLGSDYATGTRAKAADSAVEQELRFRTEYRVRYLQWCSETEYRINLERKALGQAPLSSKAVCNEL